PREIVCYLLESLGFHTLTAVASAEEALALLQSSGERFSCVITDIRMPRIDGSELVRQVRRDPRLQHLPVIALTAHATSDTLVGCLRAGVSGFVVKPPRKEQLERELARARRIALGRQSPRLATHGEADFIEHTLLGEGC